MYVHVQAVSGLCTLLQNKVYKSITIPGFNVYDAHPAMICCMGVCDLQVDIVTGTPGRLEDLISTGKLDLQAIRFFVLDEAVSSS